ncbi:MAG: protein YgfX [Gammaproteobacteria bacterium]
MSSAPFTTTLRIRPERSLILAATLVASHVMALAVLLVLSLPLALHLALAALVLTSLALALRTHWWRRGGRVVVEVVWESGGEWFVVHASGKRMRARLGAGTFVNRWLTILDLRLDGGGSRSVVLLPDTVNPDALRVLRARLQISTPDRQQV